MPKSSHPEADAIRRQVLSALAANRAPGFHFPGHLLALAWPKIGDDHLEEVMPDGPQARNVDGTVNLTAFCVHLDTALATASRLKLERGELSARTRMNGYATGAAARESLTNGTVYAGGAPVCHASATFIGLPPPPGVNLAPLPWQRDGSAPGAPLDLKALEPEERKVMAACNSALKRADQRRAFIERFWGALPVATDTGARCTVGLGSQHGNRVGHVQGGLLLGLAAVTAQAAAPRHPRLSAISAWYISPGQGRALKIASRRFHEGRSFAAVRTEIRNADGSRVLEVVSHHGA